MKDPTPALLRAERDFYKFLDALFDSYESGERARVAERLGFEYHMLYRRMRGGVIWKPDELRRFIAACPDAQVGQWFLEESRFIAVERPAVAAADGNMRKAVADAVRQTVDIWEELGQCTDFNALTKAERENLLEETREAEQAIANIRAMLLDPSLQSPDPSIRDRFSSV